MTPTEAHSALRDTIQATRDDLRATLLDELGAADPGRTPDVEPFAGSDAELAALLVQIAKELDRTLALATDQARALEDLAAYLSPPAPTAPPDLGAIADRGPLPVPSPSVAPPPDLAAISERGPAPHQPKRRDNRDKTRRLRRHQHAA